MFLCAIFTSLSPINDEVYFLKAQIYYRRHDIEKTTENYLKIINDYSGGILADDVIFNLAKMYELEIKDIEQAKELYKKILTEHGYSIFVAEARKRFRELRGDI